MVHLAFYHIHSPVGPATAGLHACAADVPIPDSASARSSQRPLVCPRPLPAPPADIVTRVYADDPNGRDFHEISGLAISPGQVGPSGEPVFFAAADGPRERIGLFDSGTGRRLLSLRLPGGVHTGFDWESLAIGPCGKQGTGDDDGDDDVCVYVADVGDNVSRNTRGRRSKRDGGSYWLYKIREPMLEDYDDNDRIRSSHVWVLPYDYLHDSSPTDFADCEAVFVDHVGWGEDGARGDVYVLTKWNSEEKGNARLFKIPASAWSIDTGDNTAPLYSPAAVGDYDNDGIGGGSLTRASWTRADMALDGTIIALGDYGSSFLFLRCPGQSVEEALILSPPCATWPNSFSFDARQFETTALSPDGTLNLQVSECSSCDMPMIWTTLEYDESTTSRICPHSSSSNFSSVPSSETSQPVSSAPPSLLPSRVMNVPTRFPMLEPSEVPTIPLSAEMKTFTITASPGVVQNNAETSVVKVASAASPMLSAILSTKILIFTSLVAVGAR